MRVWPRSRSPPGRPGGAPGLATVLILLLAKAAAERGIHTFSASYFADNRPIAALVQDAGELGTQVIEQGFAEFSLALDRQPPATGPAKRPAEDA